MPQSIRDQILAAIAAEIDNGRRAVLLILLSISDQGEDVRSCVGDLVERVEKLTDGFMVHDKQETEWRNAMFGNLTPPIHIDDHSFVAEARNRRKEDQAIIGEAKKAAVGKAVQLLIAFAVGVAGMAASKYLGI